jgi:caffeoyl-CoA O-methyltransferase
MVKTNKVFRKIFFCSILVVMDKTIFEKVDNYITGLFATEDNILMGIEQSLIESNANMPAGSISANQGRFLQILALMCNAKKILELGTLGGYSTIWLARCLPEDGRLITVEHDDNHAVIAKKNIEKAGLLDKVEIRLGKAMDVLAQLKEENAGPFDMVFIDADKPPYTEYFQLTLGLSRPGTVIAADNVIRAGKVLDKESSDAAVTGVKRFNQMLSQNGAVTATILQMVGIKEHDGMAIAVVN